MKSCFLVLIFLFFVGSSSAAEPQTWGEMLKEQAAPAPVASKSSRPAEFMQIGSHTVAIPAGTPPDLTATAKKYLPQLPRLCPGWQKYENSYANVTIENNVTPDVGGYLDVRFTVSGRDNIPEEYRAYGHNCYYGISADGRVLAVSKRACQSLCLDKDMFRNGSSGPLEIPLE